MLLIPYTVRGDKMMARQEYYINIPILNIYHTLHTLSEEKRKPISIASFQRCFFGMDEKRGSNFSSVLSVAKVSAAPCILSILFFLYLCAKDRPNQHKKLVHPSGYFEWEKRKQEKGGLKGGGEGILSKSTSICITHIPF